MNREPFLLARFASLAVIGGLIWIALGAAALWVWETFA